MNYLRVDTNRNNTIIEISGSEFIDLLAHEIQVESDYDFPTGQPLIYYRWNDTYVDVNDEETIKTYLEEAGTLSGLDLEPHIENVLRGDFIPSSSKEITIEGVNFSPYSVVEISGSGNSVTNVYFDTPNQLRIDVTVGSIEGNFNLMINNNELDSDESGHNTIIVKSKTIVDLRTESIANLGLEMTAGITVAQDAVRGINFTVGSTSWNRGVKITAHPWDRSGNTTYEVIFVNTANAYYMHGIASSLLDVTGATSALYQQQEIGMYRSTATFNTMYGGGDAAAWTQNIGKTIRLALNTFYKLKLTNSGGDGAECSIWEANPDDWDDETLLHSWVSNCPADDLVLMPFMLPCSTGGAYYLTAIRY